MIAGTFNLVMAQRLTRKICEHCKTQYSIAGTELHDDVRAAFVNFDQEKLAEEIMARGIDQQQWDLLISE
jgi:type II secretory ATPase GspE/PulE/Tfp pilus assembly ATPase PilB-like protein